MILIRLALLWIIFTFLMSSWHFQMTCPLETMNSGTFFLRVPTASSKLGNNLPQRRHSFRGVSHTYIQKQNKNRVCHQCRQQSYWKFRLCKNQDCKWHFNRRGGLDEAKRRFQRKLWRRVIFGKGKFHEDIEKALSKTKYKQLHSKKARVLKVYQVIRGMMTELPGGMTAPDHTRIPLSPPLSIMPKNMPRKYRAPQKRQRSHCTWPQKRQRSPEPQVAKQKGKNSAPWHNPKQQQWHPRIRTGKNRGVWLTKNTGKHRPLWPANKKL